VTKNTFEKRGGISLIPAHLFSIWAETRKRNID